MKIICVIKEYSEATNFSETIIRMKKFTNENATARELKNVERRTRKKEKKNTHKSYGQRFESSGWIDDYIVYELSLERLFKNHLFQKERAMINICENKLIHKRD